MIWYFCFLLHPVPLLVFSFDTLNRSSISSTVLPSLRRHPFGSIVRIDFPKNPHYICCVYLMHNNLNYKINQCLTGKTYRSSFFSMYSNIFDFCAFDTWLLRRFNGLPFHSFPSEFSSTMSSSLFSYFMFSSNNRLSYLSAIG